VYAITAGQITVATTAGIYPDDPNRCGDTLILQGYDGATYTHCHLTGFAVQAGQYVDAGQLIATTGGQPGTPGAGNTTGPHLHLAINVDGTTVCPQPLLLAIHRGERIDVSGLPTSGCTS
jgi:murein DD-endopeptidase MepM/ murein hydrolase activator NlpD